MEARGRRGGGGGAPGGDGGGVADALLEEVDVLLGVGVEAVAPLLPLDLLEHHRAEQPRVGRDLRHGRAERRTYQVRRQPLLVVRQAGLDLGGAQG